MQYNGLRGNFTSCNSSTKVPYGFVPDFSDNLNVNINYSIYAGQVTGQVGYKIIGNTKYFDFDSISHIPSTQHCILEAVLEPTDGTSEAYDFFTVVNYAASETPKLSSTVLTNKIELDNCEQFVKLWKKRTHLIYTKMLNMWKNIIPDSMWIKNKNLLVDGKTNTQLARAIVACTKLDFYQQLMLWENSSNNILPFDTGLAGQPYTVINLLQYDSGVNTSFSIKLKPNNNAELFPL